LQAIGSAAPSETVQFVFVSATLPPGVADQLRLEFPGLQLVTGPGLHRISPRVDVELIDCSAREREIQKQKETSEMVALAAERIGAGAERGSGSDYYEDEDDDDDFQTRRRYRNNNGNKKTSMRWDSAEPEPEPEPDRNPQHLFDPQPLKVGPRA